MYPSRQPGAAWTSRKRAQITEEGIVYQLSTVLEEQDRVRGGVETVFGGCSAKLQATSK